MTIQEILPHFAHVKEIGHGQFCMDCPACEDRNRHLYMKDEDGKILLDCKHGCTFSEIVQASGLRKEDFFVFANITDFTKPGLYQIDLRCTLEKNGITKFEINPQRIGVKLERVSKR